MKHCPHCSKEIQPAALICRHCNHDFRTAAVAPQTAPIAAGDISTPPRKSRTVWYVVAFLAVMALASTQFTFFVVQPIGAVPEGRTL
jgi:hypothetical protein